MRGVTEKTLTTMQEALAKGDTSLLQKAFTQATGLVNIDLQAGARILYPVITPFRDMVPRVKGSGGLGPNWRAITAINASSQYSGTGEGKRGGAIDTTVKSYFGNYKTLGLEDYVTFEADFAAEQFDDAKARAVEGLLRSLMIQEENVMIGGNSSLALGTPDRVSIGDVGSGGSIGTGTTVHVRVVALTHEGYQRATVAGGIQTEVTKTNTDSTTDVFGGGSSNISVDQSISTGANSDSLTAVTTAVQGAVAYAWFWGATAAGATLGAITTINSYVITTATGSGTQQASAVTKDNSRNALAYDGALYLALGAGQENPGAVSSGALVNIQATGTPGTGTPLTSDGAGGVVEIETDLQSFWDNYKLSPTHLFVNSREYKKITSLVVSAGGAPLLRLNTEAKGGVSQASIQGGLVVTAYIKKYGVGSGEPMHIVVHPNLAPGTMLYVHDKLPYPLSNVQNPMALKYRRDYYQLEWPIRSRKYEYGVYVDSLFQHYFPPSLGVRTNIGA